MKQQEIEKSVVSLTSMIAGGMISRVVNEKLPIKDSKVKTGVLALAGLLGASYFDRKTTGNSIAKDMSLATALIQSGNLIKELIGDNNKNSTLKTALGSSFNSWNDPFELDSTTFLSSYASPNYDPISEDITYQEIEDFNS